MYTTGSHSALKVQAEQVNVLKSGYHSTLKVRADKSVVLGTGDNSHVDVIADTIVYVLGAGEGSQITGTDGTIKEVNLQSIENKSATVTLTRFDQP